MKKSLTAMAVAAVLVTPMVASADGDMTVYGRGHVALQGVNDGTDTVVGVDSTSAKGNAVGVKGGVDTNLMDFKAIYQFEIGLNGEKNAGKGEYFQRDTWVGVNSKSLGKVTMGTVTTHYKQTAKQVDPLFLTGVEARGDLAMHSGLAGGLGEQAGRATDTIRYDIPAVVPGLKATATYQFNTVKKNNMGFGASYMAGPADIFVSYVAGEGVDKNGKVADATATKVGATAGFGDASIGFNYEIDGGMISGNTDDTTNMMFVNAAYKIGSSTLTASYGMKDDGEVKDSGHSSYAVALIQNLAKKTNAYAAYGSAMPNDSALDSGSLWAIGMIHNF